MKINKITVIICFAGAIISMIIYIVLSFINCSLSTLEYIVLNIFTGFMVSLIISLTGYYHERQKLIRNACDFLKSELQFINFYHLQVGKLIQLCTHDFDYNKTMEYYAMFSKRCDRVDAHLSLVIETSEKLNETDYSGFFNRSKLVIALNDIYDFKRDINSLRHLSSEIVRLSLEVHVFLQTHEINIMSGKPVDSTSVNVTMDFHNKNLLIKLSKLHEYTASLVLTVTKLLTVLCENANCGLKSKDVDALANHIKNRNKELCEGEL